MQESHTDRTDSVAPKKRSFLGYGLALTLAAAAFFSGLEIGQGQQRDLALQAGLFSFFAAPSQPEEADLTEFWRVWELMEEKFVSASSTETFSTEKRIQGAIDGLVDSYGDPYTDYLLPVDASQFEEDISGNFGGVGMEVGIRDGVVSVIAPLPETPAERAGLLAGDAIVEIDGVSTDRMGIDEAVRMIRGEVGTEVVLTIYREGEAEFRDIAVVRGTITIPTINTELQGDVFVISLYSFNALADQMMREALVEYRDSGANKLVLDLRSNPGGFLQSAVTIASYFIPSGKVIVSERGAEGEESEEYRSTGRTLRGLEITDMVVLVNQGSASASEILAGALSQHGVATLVGNTTFGKGSVQELVELPDGSSLKVTVARWFTPNGTSISDGGLSPDYEVAITAEQVQADIDPQLEAAIRLLRGEQIDDLLATTTPETEE